MWVCGCERGGMCVYGGKREGKGGGEMGVWSTVQKPKAQNGSRINVLLLCSIQ